MLRKCQGRAASSFKSLSNSKSGKDQKKTAEVKEVRLMWFGKNQICDIPNAISEFSTFFGYYYTFGTFIRGAKKEFSVIFIF